MEYLFGVRTVSSTLLQVVLCRLGLVSATQINTNQQTFYWA